MTEPYWWRSFEERAGDPAYREAAAREFADLGPDGVGRRRFLQLMASSMALAGVAGCGPSPEEIVPRVDQAPGETAGVPRYVATAVVREGYASGAILQHRTGRPVKLEGNPDHPASLGASDAIMQASLLDLYDPDRSAEVLTGGRVGTWRLFDRAVETRRTRWQADGGAGLRVLTGRVTSPTLAAQLDALTRRYPQAQWHGWEPLPRDAIYAGAMLALGKAVDTLPRFEAADVVLAVESDALSGAPGHLAFARAFASRRQAAELGRGSMNRVYAIEATPTLIGARADHRFALPPAQIETVMRALAGLVQAGPAEWRQIDHPPWLEPVSFFSVFAGLFLIVSRKRAVSQVLGFLVMENGIYTFGVGVVTGTPLLVEAGVLLDVFVAVFVMGIIIFHINREFDHIEGDRLSTLKD